MHQYSKTVKRLLNEWKCEAHERELHQELTKLDHEFTRWRAGEIESGELALIVENCTKGPIRQLFSIYNNSFQDDNVAYAVATGILHREELPAALLAVVEEQIERFVERQGRNELATPEERLQDNARRRRRGN